jgi:hypothetical protein
MTKTKGALVALPKAARELGLPLARVRRAVRRGEFPIKPVFIDGEWRVSRAALSRLVGKKSA